LTGCCGVCGCTLERWASLKALAAQLEKVHSDAAGSLREGTEETLTFTRLKITGTVLRRLFDQLHREHGRRCAHYPAQCQALTRWRHATTLDPPPAWPKPNVASGASKGHRDLPTELINASRRELNPAVPTDEAVTLIAA